MIKKTDSIYIAGHTGLIGSALVRVFVGMGYGNLILRTRTELDLMNRLEVEKFFDVYRPKYVLLAAGKVGGIIENQTYPADFITSNLIIQSNVIAAAHQHEVETLVLFGSSCMYPRECPQPMAEELILTGKPEFTSMAYAISKLAGVEMCQAYNRQYGFNRFITVIPNSAYGPNDNFSPSSGHVLSVLIRRFREAVLAGDSSITLWGSGEPRREFVYSDDIAYACLSLLEQNLANVGFPINIGVGDDISIKELAEHIAKISGFRGDIQWDTTKPDGAPRKLLDSSRIRALGWLPRVSFDEGLRQTYNWYLANEL